MIINTQKTSIMQNREQRKKIQKKYIIYRPGEFLYI